ncbi:alpha 1,2 mannosyltransferase [Saxophila tyrrhenica]|uniref:Mannosyltransferase n=1 Tax=Saxophila tyrrhenica TaxID=1690608 RepID=A0AAV9P6L4_9PEZI|nr:alpha 1,2 mannosyltransferase [Saxophila tyrrhenica]
MWRRLYLFLLLVRLYFAIQPSYIHPDEHFQGPEIIAAQVFDWPSDPPWEFTDDEPIRSYFPLWLAYGFPLTLLKWIWEGLGYGNVQPMLAFYALRIFMFILSFVLEDWALHELIPSPRDRTRAIALVASSYVTWTFQMHTFSNSIETLLVLWCIVLMRRIREHPESTMASACCGLAFMGVLGVFNRITFPAFILVPALQLIPHLFTRTMRIPILLFGSLLTMAIAVTVDTEIYASVRPSFSNLRGTTIFTPLNNLMYNLDPENLAEHGLHPYWQHFAANLPQLLGPAIPLLLFSSRKNALFWSGITGIAALSCFQHQEARFLLPAVPLLLASVKLPVRFSNIWFISWILFNATVGLLFGAYHQAGIVPAQRFLARGTNTEQITWWRTYPPPTWLGGSFLSPDVKVKDYMGTPHDQLFLELYNRAECQDERTRVSMLVAPLSAVALDPYMETPDSGMYGATIKLEEVWRTSKHIRLDDLDFAGDGVWKTLRRVIGRRGLAVYVINKKC